jgi:hypothetical protein
MCHMVDLCCLVLSVAFSVMAKSRHRDRRIAVVTGNFCSLPNP